MRAQVVVIGAGPAGAVAAYRLAAQAIDVVLLEADSEPAGAMRPSTFNPATLDMMEELGWLEQLEAQGLKSPIYQHRDRSTGEVLSLDFSEVADELRHPYRLHCEQQKLGQLGTRKLIGNPHAHVEFQQRVVDLEQDDGGATVYCETSHGVDTFHADYVVVAEGAESIASNLLGVRFEGFMWPQKFLALSTDYPIESHFDDLAHVNYMSDEDGWRVMVRTPSAWHLLAPVSEDIGDEVLVSDETKDALFSTLIGGDQDIQTGYRVVHRIHQRVADRYDHGRVLLMADAAHLNVPLGGWGMNTGIHDAWNLTDKLSAVIKDRADSRTQFGRYDRQRRTVMQTFLGSQIVRNRAAPSGSGRQGRRRIELEAVLSDRRRCRDYLLELAMVKDLHRAAQIA